MELIIIAALILVGILAGILGGVFGLGGGVIFIPVLILIFGLKPDEAAAISLVGIIAGSLGSTSVQVTSGKANVRLGLLLEIASVVGAIVGASLAIWMDDVFVLVVLIAVLAFTGYTMSRKDRRTAEPVEGNGDRLSFEYAADDGTTKTFRLQHMSYAYPACIGAGIVSSLTGIGGGAIKVPLMNLVMRVPIKVATSTSSYMVGITALTGALVYATSGILITDYAAGIAIGALIGSVMGAFIVKKIDAKHLKRYFGYVLIAVSLLMLYKVGGYT
jgi:hypothetical protein